MKNKKVYVILIVLILIGSIFLTYNIYQNKNKVIKTKKRKQNNLAIMIKENGATDYTKSNSKDIPKGNYTLNYEKSYCKNNGVIGDYDSSLGKVSFSFIGTDSCYLYFDYKEDTSLYETIKKRAQTDTTYLALYEGEGANTYANPVYYYKGNVQNNNVLFAGFCWKIVRTTETGGVKIVYNGVQKETNKYSSYQKLDESDYIITNPDEGTYYNYEFDNINKVWKNQNVEENGDYVVYFNELKIKENGNYQLNALINSISEEDIMAISLNGNPIGKGKNCGEEGCLTKNDSVSIDLSLTTDDVIQIEYDKSSSSTDGTDYVQFYLQKGVGDTIKTCDNSGSDASIGTSAFNDSYNSPAYVGYMYNNVYTRSSKKILDTQYVGVGTRFSYATSVTYSNGTYTLGSDYKNYLINEENIDVFNTTGLFNKYVCFNVNSNTCTSVAYVVGFKNTNYYYYELTNGDINGKDNGQNLIFGSSFTYANGTYTLSGTTTINTDNWTSQSSNIDTHHYTCLSTGTTCTSLYYINYIYNGTLYYITLTGGKSVDDALNEMLYNDDVNTKNSTIKTYIDNWYKNNIASYTEKLEDTAFCNDRSISNKTSNGWYPNGGSTSADLYFKSYDIDINNITLKCANTNDKFTVDSSNGNGALTYSVGLLTTPEAKLANYGSDNYLNSGSTYWLLTPAVYSNMVASMYTLDSSNFNVDTVNSLRDVRPVILLKPKISISSGNGSFTSPFVISTN